ncbi:hypothetical protein PISL3812_00681 [Talaromyces islandicus]|uniref:Rhodopsin domain-containing protein n=1 Tax=Talaromyces islandicus TaxID=28573 RepID=A0A0U1LLZ4_TALIS|nr:hypothetical protein PISL3812_00681 [Talaromyces islandicus]
MTSQSGSNPGPALARGIWAAMAVAIIVLIFRLIAKIKIRHFGLDDVLMSFALGLSITSTVFLTLCVNHGFGKDLLTLPSESLMLVLKYIAIQVPLITISTGIARTSFVLYLLRILGTNKKYQIALWISMLLQLCGNIVSAVLPLSICRNVNILWDANVKTTCGDITAVVKFSYFSSSVNTATDFFLAVFPTIVFWNLNLKFGVKITLIILLSLGLLAMVASIIKTTALDQVPSVTNIGASGGIDLIRWGYAENAIIIITSSVPCIRPLIMSSVRKLSSVTKSKSYELTSPLSRNRVTSVVDVTSESRRSGRHTSTDDRMGETDSIERILAGDEGRGITKQVDITIVSSNED